MVTHKSGVSIINKTLGKNYAQPFLKLFIIKEKNIMKNLFIALFLSALILSGCQKCTKSPTKRFFDSMHLVRQGGGQIDFMISASDDNFETINILITEYHFRDTAIQINLQKTNNNANVFTTLHDALNNKLQISGEFKQSTLPTGTWCYIYLLSNGTETEVTNINLRNTLLQFEQLVRGKIEN